MRFRDYFYDRVKELIDNITDKIALSHDFTPAEKESEISKLESRKIRYADKMHYNNNNLREVIPVLKTADSELAEETRNSIRNEAKTTIKQLHKSMNLIDSKRNELIKAVGNFCKAEYGKQFFTMFKDDASRNIVLYSPIYDKGNLVDIEKSGKTRADALPAIVTVDLDTNVVKSYYTVDEMFRKDEKYANISPSNDSYIYSSAAFAKDISQNGTSFYADGDFNSALELIDAEFDREAEILQNRVLRTQQKINFSILNEIENLAQVFPNVDFDKLSNKVTIYDEMNRGVLTLNYSTDGLTSAYFRNDFGEVSKVYDYRDNIKGFSNIQSPVYHKLLKSKEFESFLNIDGNYLDSDSLKTYEDRLLELSKFTDIKYTEKNVGVVDVCNTTFNYRLFYSDDLKNTMLKKAQEYKNAVPPDVNVTYNPFNNTINLSSQGKVVSITFDEFGSRMDMFFKNENDRVRTSDILVENGKLYNKKVLEDEAFKHITQNLCMSLQDIARGQAGKIMTEKELQIKNTKNNIER